MSEDDIKDLDRNLYRYGVSYYNKKDNRVIPSNEARVTLDRKYVVQCSDWVSMCNVYVHNINDILIECLGS